MSRFSDTSPEAERVLIDIYRRMPLAVKWRRLGDLYSLAKRLHAAGVRSRNPAASTQEIHEDWLAVALGKEWLKTLKEKGYVRQR